MSLKVTVVIQRDDDWYVAKCLENSVVSQGKTVEEAMANLREALELHYEDIKAEEIAETQLYVTTLEVSVQ